MYVKRGDICEYNGRVMRVRHVFKNEQGEPTTATLVDAARGLAEGMVTGVPVKRLKLAKRPEIPAPVFTPQYQNEPMKGATSEDLDDYAVLVVTTW